MAKLSPITILLILPISSIILVSFCSADERNSVVVSVEQPPRLQKPMQTHMQFYWHETFLGPNASSIIIAGRNSTNSAALGFGTTYAFDIPLMLEPIVPNKTSDVVGNAQGLYVQSAKEEVGITILLNLVLKEEMFKDSVLTFQGRVNVTSQQREVPVSGGSGVFRYATGYYVSQFVSADPVTNENIALLDVYVNTYSYM